MTLNLDKSTWKRVSLGDVIRHVTDRVDPENSGLERFLAGEHIPSNSLHIREWGVIGRDPVGPMFYKRFKPGHVLYVSRRSYLRKTAVPEFEGICGEKTFVLETIDESVLSQRYLPFVLSAEVFHRYAVSMSRGSVNPYINWTDLVKYEFDLPPLAEQERLAGLLWAVEWHRESLQSALSQILIAFNGEIRKWWNSRRMAPIGSIATCVTGLTPSKSNSAYWDSPDVPFFTPSEISGDLISVPRQSVSFAGAEKGRILPVNSVAVACIGGDLGKSSVLDRPGVSNQQITSAIGLSEGDAFLLQALLSHPLGRASMKARETTTIVRKLNKSDLMKVEVPWPDQRDDMRKAIRIRRSSMSDIQHEYDALAAVRSSFCNDIFGGTA